MDAEDCSIDAPISKRARVEEVPDEEWEAGGLPKRPIVDYTGHMRLKTKGRGATLFEDLRIKREAAEKQRIEDLKSKIEEARRMGKNLGAVAGEALKENPWSPFADKQEWEWAHWVMTHSLSHTAVDD